MYINQEYIFVFFLLIILSVIVLKIIMNMEVESNNQNNFIASLKNINNEEEKLNEQMQLNSTNNNYSGVDNSFIETIDVFDKNLPLDTSICDDTNKKSNTVITNSIPYGSLLNKNSHEQNKVLLSDNIKMSDTYKLSDNIVSNYLY